MKKISYLIFILIAFIVLIPRVDAKEIDVSNLELHKEIEVEAGDKIIYDGNKRDDNFELAKIEYYSDVKEENYQKKEDAYGKFYTFSIPSFYQLLNDDIQIPAGKRVKISLYTKNYYSGDYICIVINYYLVDDIKKNVIYNNTLDAANDNV